MQLQQKLDWRLNNLLVAQNRITEKIKAVEQIIKLRKKNEMSLRDIGDQIGMSHENVRNILKQFGLYDTPKTKNIKKI
jgi:DNA-directed RNA polymerase specialized sigma subunit